MFTTDLVHRPPVDWSARPAPKRTAPAPCCNQLAAPVRGAIFAARQVLLEGQRADGSWLAPQHGDGALAGPLVLLLTFLNQEESDLGAQAAHAIRADQQPDGAWPRTPGGPGDVSVSVAAYFALKLFGDEPSEPHMRRARYAIRQLGGADAADATTRHWLALLGQIDYDVCPAFAPEWLLLSDRWQQRLIERHLSPAERRRHTALTVVRALRPKRTIAPERGIRELFLRSPHVWPSLELASTRTARLWTVLSHWCERSGLLPLRAHALDLAETLLVRDALEAETNEAGFEEIAWQIVALHALGYNDRTSAVAACEARLAQLIAVDEWDAARPRSGTRALGDTLAILTALVAGGVVPSNAQLLRAIGWLRDRLAEPAATRGVERIAEMARLATTLEAVTRDPAATRALPPDVQLAQDRTERYLARNRDHVGILTALHEPIRAARESLNERLRLLEVPHELGVALEAMGPHAAPTSHHALSAAAIRLRLAQNADGSWSATDGTPCVRTTSGAIRGLMAVGASADDPAVAAAVQWLAIEQLPSGAWSDSRQTADTVLALVAAGAAGQVACCRGVQFLLESGDEPPQNTIGITNLHVTAAKLLALARWAVATEPLEVAPVALRLVGEFAPSD